MVICNPSTGQVVDLPNPITRREAIRAFLGYDSAEDVYKVLCMTVNVNVVSSDQPVVYEEHQVFTIRSQKKIRRKITCQHPHFPVTKGLFMNGIVYYGAWSNSSRERSLLISFDVGLEEFSLVKLPGDVEIRYFRSEFVDYLGKVALVDQYLTSQLHIWVLDDVKKQEWSKIFIAVPSWKNKLENGYGFRCLGTIGTGELIFAPSFSNHPHPFFVIYYDIKEDKARIIEIEGIEDAFTDDKFLFLDHVENPMFL